MTLVENFKYCYFRVRHMFKVTGSTLGEKFDRQISGSIRKQLLCYLSVVCLTLFFVWVVGHCLGYSFKVHEGEFSTTSGVIHYFFHAGDWFREQEIGATIFAGIVSILGMLIFTGLFIAAVSNSVRERVEKIKAGQVVYKKINNHYVIIGYGGIALSLIENIFDRSFTKEIESITSIKNYTSFKKAQELSQKCTALFLPKIILFTNQNVPTVKSKIYSYFPVALESKIIIYSGNIESYANLRNTNIESAKEVYVLGEQNEDGRDIKNLEAINRISNLRGKLKQGEEKLKVYMQFDRLTSYSIIQKLPILPEYLCPTGSSEMNIFFRPFNFYENTARSLWGFTGLKRTYDKLDFDFIEKDKYVHLIIIGFNRMGRALLFEALRLCHFPNYREQDTAKGVEAKNKTKITIVDDALEAQLPTFLAEFPYLHQIEDIEIKYISALAADNKVRDIISAESINDDAMLTVAICLQDPDYSMSVGLSLPHEAYYTIAAQQPKNASTRILIRQEVQEGLSSLVDKNNTKFTNVKVFGALMTGMHEKLLCDKIPMCVNAYYDVKYADSHKQTIVQNYKDSITKHLSENNLLVHETFIDWVTDEVYHNEMMKYAEQLWALTSEDLRFANRYQVDMYGTYIKYAGHSNLAQMEHLRWNADRSIIGYRDTSEESVKNLDFQLHKLIIPFNALDKDTRKDKEIEKDKDVINNMNKLVNFFMKDMRSNS